MAGHMLEGTPRRVLTWGIVVIGLGVALSVAIAGVRKAADFIGGVTTPAPPQLTQDVVVQQLRDVARLVSSEMTLRDVVTYRQTRFGSTKQTLLVVTARVSAGIDMDKGTRVEIDSVARQITVTVPPAEIMGLDVVNVRTYDESAGLLNPFTPSDRDLIQRRIRVQLLSTANQSGLLEHADRSAAAILRELLARDGYTVEVRRQALQG